MARNRLIYTLCDYVLVVSTATEKGGIALAESEIPEGDGLRGVLEQRAEGWADLGSAQAELPFPES